ncbi:MAG: hypothetical protein HY22_13145 [[Candidatus Thermochlorobacteriaceae] bacterium GBChlB]|nr:MAG: hypothetical protein HY22_13145 [[Candidatus Thermochlorobacteriaceae] bacterium GBChlB]
MRFIGLLLLLASFSARAQTTVYEFLRLDRSARVAALGGNSVSLSGDIVALFQNPAALDSATHKQASFSFQKHILDINSGYAAYARRIESLGDVGVGVSFINYGSFENTDGVGNQSGTFSSNDLAVQVGYARELQNFGFGALRGGAAAKFIFSTIAGFSSLALALDAGVMFLVPSEQLSVGLSLVNVGTQLSRFDGTAENLPIELRFAASKRLEGLPLELTVGFVRLNDPTTNFFERFRNFTVGGEFLLSDEIRLRIGYSNQRRQDLSLTGTLGLAGVSGGLGIVLERFKFDYAFSSFGVLGGLHQLTLATVL